MAGISRRYSKLFGALGSTTALFLANSASRCRGRRRPRCRSAPGCMSSPNDLTGFTTLSGNDATANATLPFTADDRRHGLHDGRDLDQRLARVRRQHVRVRLRHGEQRSDDTTLADAEAHESLPGRVLGRPPDLQQRTSATARSARRRTASSSSTTTAYDVDPATEQAERRRPALPDRDPRGLEPDQRPLPRHRQQPGERHQLRRSAGRAPAASGRQRAAHLLPTRSILDDNRPNEGWSVDVGRAGLTTLAATIEESPDDISGFTQLTGNDSTATVALPLQREPRRHQLQRARDLDQRLGRARQQHARATAIPPTAACRFRTTRTPSSPSTGTTCRRRATRSATARSARARTASSSSIGRWTSSRRAAAGRHQRADADPRDVEPDPRPLPRRRQLERERPGGDDRLPGRGRVERRARIRSPATAR